MREWCGSSLGFEIFNLVKFNLLISNRVVGVWVKWVSNYKNKSTLYKGLVDEIVTTFEVL